MRRKRKKQKITPMARRMKSIESKASVFRATARVASRPTARFVSQTSPVSLHTTGAQPRTSLFLKSYVRFVSLMKRELQVPTTKPTLLPTSATGKINAVKLLNSYSSWDTIFAFPDISVEDQNEKLSRSWDCLGLCPLLQVQLFTRQSTTQQGILQRCSNTFPEHRFHKYLSKILRNIFHNFA